MALLQLDLRQLETTLKSRCDGMVRRYRDLFVHFDAHPRLHTTLAMVSGLALVWLVNGVTSGHFIGHPALWAMTLPALLHLFLRYNDRDVQGLYAPLSVPAASIGAAGFFLAIFARGFGQYVTLFTGLAGAMFTYMDYHAFRRLAERRVFSASMALAGGISGILFLEMQRHIWKWFARGVAKVSLALLQNFIPHLQVVASPPVRVPMVIPTIHRGAAGTVRVHVTKFRRIFGHPAPPPHPVAPVHRFPRPLPHPHPVPHPVRHIMMNHGPDNVYLASDHFTLSLVPLDNVTLGMFVLVLMLSAGLVAYGREVRPLRLATALLGGIVMLFTANVLVTTLYFILGDLSFTPGAEPAIEMMKQVFGFLLHHRLICIAGYALICGLFLKAVLPEAMPFKFRKAHS